MFGSFSNDDGDCYKHVSWQLFMNKSGYFQDNKACDHDHLHVKNRKLWDKNEVTCTSSLAFYSKAKVLGTRYKGLL